MDKLGGEVNKYINKLQDDIAIYLRGIENEYFDSTEYLELKVNNYLTSIKEDVVYEFYKYLQNKAYEIDVIEEYKNRLSKKLEDIDIKLVDNKYYILKKRFTQNMKELNEILDKLIDIKEDYDDNIGNNSYIESKRVRLDNINKIYSEKINAFVRSLGENLDISKINYFVISDDLAKELRSRVSNARILKRKYKREFDIIQDQINNQIASISKKEFLELANNALQTIINTLKEEINNVNPNDSYKEEQNYIENNYYTKEQSYSGYNNQQGYDKYHEEQYNDGYIKEQNYSVYTKKQMYSEQNQEPIYIIKEECNEEESYVVDNNYSYENSYSNKSTCNKIKSIEDYEIIEVDKVAETTAVVGFTRSIENTEDSKTYEEKEEIKNILITTSSGRKISISIDECKANMKEVSFNRLMAAINKLIRER